MTSKQIVRTMFIAAAIGEIIMEKFLTKTLQPGDELTLGYLTSIMPSWNEKQIKLLKNYKNDLFSFEENIVKITAGVEFLSLKTREHVMFLIKNYVNTSECVENSYAYETGKFIEDIYYNQRELDFINEVFNTIYDISDTEISEVQLQEPPHNTIMAYNALNRFGFHFAAGNIYDSIIKGTLHAGDNITENLKEYFEDNEDNKLLLILADSNLYEWFWELDKDSNIILRCDIETNRKLFIMNFISTVIYRFRDYKARVKLLRQLHIKCGLLRK